MPSIPRGAATGQIRQHAAPHGQGSSAPQGAYRPAGTPGGYQPMGSHGGYPPSNDEIIRVRKKRKKHKKAVRIALIVLAVLLVLVGGTAAYGAWYMNSLAGNMAMDAQEESQLEGVLAAPADSQAKPFYALLVGSDKWETFGERSDAMVLLRVDQANSKITMVSIPRDTPYELNGGKTKINQAFATGGAAGAVTAVQDLTGVEISYYAEIEFDGLAKFVDSMGGIYVDVPYTIDYQVYTKDQDVVHIEAGNQLLNGTECVALARMRTAYDNEYGQDATRQANVRAMTVALLKNVLQSPPAEIPGLVQGLSECISTNMDMQTMISLATGFAQGGSPTIYTCTGPYAGDIDAETGAWLCFEDPEGWATLMKAVDAGENPETAETTVNGN